MLTPIAIVNVLTLAVAWEKRPHKEAVRWFAPSGHAANESESSHTQLALVGEIR